MKGEWKLLYSTVSILGSRRTKLGLRDFITLGDFIQVIDVEKVNFMRRLKYLLVSLFHPFDMEWQVSFKDLYLIKSEQGQEYCHIHGSWIRHAKWCPYN